MKHETKETFHAAAPELHVVSMMDAIGAAKKAVLAMTGMEADSVANCQKDDDGIWRVSVDIIESPARMGDNDLLATYEVVIGPKADLQSFARLRRYHREDEGA